MEVLGCLVKPGQRFARSVYNLDTLLGTLITQTLSSYLPGEPVGPSGPDKPVQVPCPQPHNS